MDRREFLRDATKMLLVLPFGTFLLECGSSDNGTTSPTTTTNPTMPGVDTTPPDAPPVVQGANILYTSSQTNAHSHSFSVPSANLTSPPPAGVSGATTAAQLHSHEVVITQADFQAAMAGQTVKVETSNVAGHTHTFTIVRVG